MDYSTLIDEDHTCNQVKRETYYLGMRNGSMRRLEYDQYVQELDCNALIDEDHTWNRVKRETYYLVMRNGSMRREEYVQEA